MVYKSLLLIFALASMAAADTGSTAVKVIGAPCPRYLVGTSSAVLTTNTAETVFVSSGAAGVYNDFTSVIAINTSATAARIDFRSGGGPSGGTITFAIYVPAGETRGFATSQIWPQSTAAANWTIQGSASVTDLRVFAAYCKDK